MELQIYAQKLDELFLKGGVLNSGYTQYMLKTLRQSERLVLLPGQRLRKIGGISSCPDAVVAECLSHMRGWVAIVMQSLSAEFPSWEVCFAFHAFRLSPPWPEETMVRRRLNKIAEVWEIDKHNLISQFNDFGYFARLQAAKCQRQPDTDFNAWAESIRRVCGQHHSAHKARHPCKELTIALMRMGVFLRSSTGSNERDFSDFAS
jgi:hypothetical protein